MLISVLALLVSTAALIVVIWYTRKTHQISSASVEQGEALQEPSVVSEAFQKPCVVIESSEVVQTPNVQLRNIGNGPAIRLKYKLRQVELPEGCEGMTPSAFISYLQAKRSWITDTASDMLSGQIFEFSAEYESLSGSKYQTKVRVDDGRVASFIFNQIEQQPQAKGRSRHQAEVVAAWLAVLAGLGALYIGAWTLHESRDVALETEEYRLAADFAKDGESRVTREQIACPCDS